MLLLFPVSRIESPNAKSAGIVSFSAIIIAAFMVLQQNNRKTRGENNMFKEHLEDIILSDYITKRNYLHGYTALYIVVISHLYLSIYINLFPASRKNSLVVLVNCLIDTLSFSLAMANACEDLVVNVGILFGVSGKKGTFTFQLSYMLYK